MAAEITMKGTPWVEFGPGACGQLSFLADTFGCERTFAVVDAGAADAVEPLLREGLGERLVAVSRYEAGEPTVELADSFAAEARQAGARSVVGAGGGSAMDVAKSVAVLLTNPGSAADYQGFGLVREQGSPLVLIPTTAGSGSEATWSAVLINEATGIKRGINGPQVFARAAILDPELTLGLPPRQTAVSGMDALIHALESFAAANATAFSRMFAREALELIFPALPRAVDRPDDLDARSALLLGAYFAGVAIINSEVGLSHALSYPLSVRHRVPHGLGNAILVPGTTGFNAQAAPEIYDEVGQLTGADPAPRSREMAAFLDDYVERLGISARLSDFGVTEGELDELAREALTLRGPLDNHRRPVDEESARKIYAAVL